MVALVTGHRGFIGRHVVQALHHDGSTVVGAGRPEMEIPSPTFQALLDTSAPELVVHCAGPASVQAAEAAPHADRAGSVDVLEALLGSLRRLPHPPRLLLVSSAAVYGNPPELPVRTESPLRPISVYGRNRAECERRALGSGLPVTIARVFSAYGEGLRRQVWWDVSQRALTGHVALEGTGEETRDFVHGEDTGRALALLSRVAGFDGDVFNVATGIETTIRSLAERLTARIRPDAAVSFSGRVRAGDPLRWRADVSAIERAGFSPRIDLPTGVDRYARWIEQQ